MTLVLSYVGIVVSLPLGILLALGRRSKMPAIKLLSVIFIETVRGVPLVTVLFMASFMLPLFVPPGVTFDKFLRALIGVALFASAYMAEVVRGGLQAIPKGQYEGADSLGLGYWQKMRLIIMPQALKLVIPGIVNTFIGMFKDTTLVLIISMFDLLGIVKQNLVRRQLGDAADGQDRARLRRHRVLAVLLRHVALFDLHGTPARYRPQTIGQGVRLMITENAVSAEEIKVDVKKMHISDTDVAIEIVAMSKWYGDFNVLKDINLKVMRGERIVICGPSGSGKSTMIRCINRLEEHQKGKIVVDGKELTNDLKKIDEVRREVGMVFQHFNLFPHLTILENCTLAPIWVRKTAQEGGRGDRHAFPQAREDSGAGEQISRPALRRPAAARRDRPLALHEPTHHALRRADLRARSRR